MKFYNVSKIFLTIAVFAAFAAAQDTFSAASFTTPITNIRTILTAVGGGLVLIAIIWQGYKYIMGDRDALKRGAGIIAAGIIIFAMGPALEFITGNSAFNQ
jgi:type IV secretory pathway VirB2 component (pilin)